MSLIPKCQLLVVLGVVAFFIVPCYHLFARPIFCSHAFATICNCFLRSFYSFDKKPKKYTLVLPESNPENKRKRMSEVLKPFELTECPASRLGEELQSFMKAIVSDLQTEMRKILVPPQIFFPKFQIPLHF